MRVFFVFGSSATKREKEIIENERRNYKDIVQTEFRDTYRNLSYKVCLKNIHLF